VEVEIGIGKTGRRAYGFDEIAVVPSRRTRDPEDIDISWEIDAFAFELPLIAAAMDGVVSPRIAVEVGRLGGLACLNLEGLWTRYEDPEPLFEEIAELPAEKATRRMQEIYAEPINEELIGARVREMKAGGVTTCASLTPQRVERYAKHVVDAELDLLVIQGTVVSAEHVSKDDARQPLNLKKFIREFDLPVVVGGCASYSTALHLMRTGAVGVLVGVGPGHACTTRGVLGIGVPQATAIADAAGARIRNGGTYLCIEGPQFSTRAESNLYRSWKIDVISMTAMQEARLAREAELCYATLTLVTDYDCWHQGAGPVDIAEILRVMRLNVEKAQRTVVQLAVELGKRSRTCTCAQALRNGIITDRIMIPATTLEDLQLIIGKYL